MKALFSFFVVAFSVLAFQKMSNQEFVEAQATGDRNVFSGIECPLDGISCTVLETVTIRPKK